jgi:hypothetical protein
MKSSGARSREDSCLVVLPTLRCVVSHREKMGTHSTSPFHHLLTTYMAHSPALPAHLESQPSAGKDALAWVLFSLAFTCLIAGPSLDSESQEH